MDDTEPAPRPAPRPATRLEGDRGDLSQPPPVHSTDRPPPASAPSTQSGGFDLNRPTIIALLYIASFVTGITAILGVVLAYVWKGESGQPEWTQSHYTYLANTFWIGLIGSVIGVVLMLVLVGFLVLIGVAVLVVIRTVFSLVNAQKQQPMPNPASWLV